MLEWIPEVICCKNVNKKIILTYIVTGVWSIKICDKMAVKSTQKLKEITKMSLHFTYTKNWKRKGKLLPKNEEISRGKAHINTQKLI